MSLYDVAVPSDRGVCQQLAAIKLDFLLELMCLTYAAHGSSASWPDTQHQKHPLPWPLAANYTSMEATCMPTPEHQTSEIDR